ncbi:hypothetical protein AJ79_07050 [Helicocarpus griseus UAMH5409]|uniref:Uncharacterized protein n=1 Tax=Helicocarpus griseus UAMH5409 TaxID=1447875 RepID=A0A2B7WYV7_9EURO|nr:hypothetical protein AJ79_07050 [Helicocarpus griseus UAMH5409]
MAAAMKWATSLCRACRTTSKVQFRAFSSTPRQMVGPESPKFIDIPPQIQPFHPHKPPVKGTLPVPRELFPPSRPDKITKAYRAAACPEAKRRKTVSRRDPNYASILFKSKMANVRRANLRSGLKALRKRKVKSARFWRKRSKAKIAQRKQIIAQGPREDERLMQQSTLQVMKATRSPVLSDLNMKSRVEASRKKHAMKQKSKQQQRSDHLHSLYMNARTFIINEEQLKAEIDRVFPEGENPAWANDEDVGENIWNLGLPSSVESMVNASKNDAAIWNAGEKRVKKIAEELTGGAI